MVKGLRQPRSSVPSWILDKNLQLVFGGILTGLFRICELIGLLRMFNYTLLVYLFDYVDINMDKNIKGAY